MRPDQTTRPTPLQNRVTPTGEIVADPSRGLLMGNRGCLHGQERHLGTSRWRSAMWICCVLSWQNVRRDVMPPNRWTALFFLDEATALAAGHRPCGYCRRPDHRWFAESWRIGHNLTERPRAFEMDKQLHRQRVNSRTRHQITRPATISTLPDGVMVCINESPGLLADGQIHPWTFTGYDTPIPLSPNTTVELLTPPSITAAIAAGYRPLVHPSAKTTTLRGFE